MSRFHYLGLYLAQNLPKPWGFEQVCDKLQTSRQQKVGKLSWAR